MTNYPESGAMVNERDQQILQERVDRAERALERCERVSIASRYASVVMHEVSNHLESITNLVYLTRLDAAIPDQVKGNLESIDEQLEIIGRVARQSLSFHRDQAEMKDVDLAEITRSVLKLHAAKILKHGVEIETHFVNTSIAHVFEGEIFQVISNLLLNALDAVQPRNGRLSIRVRALRDSVHIVVSDNGQGIPNELVKTLFEPYTTSKHTGTGLGLWLSKRIVERHKGTIRFKTSRLAHRSGTSFCVSLPIALAA